MSHPTISFRFNRPALGWEVYLFAPPRTPAQIEEMQFNCNEPHPYTLTRIVRDVGRWGHTQKLALYSLFYDDHTLLKFPDFAEDCTLTRVVDLQPFDPSHYSQGCDCRLRLSEVDPVQYQRIMYIYRLLQTWVPALTYLFLIVACVVVKIAARFYRRTLAWYNGSWVEGAALVRAQPDHPDMADLICIELASSRNYYDKIPLGHTHGQLALWRRRLYNATIGAMNTYYGKPVVDMNYYSKRVWDKSLVAGHVDKEAYSNMWHGLEVPLPGALLNVGDQFNGNPIIMVDCDYFYTADQLAHIFHKTGGIIITANLFGYDGELHELSGGSHECPHYVVANSIGCWYKADQLFSHGYHRWRDYGYFGSDGKLCRYMRLNADWTKPHKRLDDPAMRHPTVSRAEEFGRCPYEVYLIAPSSVKVHNNALLESVAIRATLPKTLITPHNQPFFINNGEDLVPVNQAAVLQVSNALVTHGVWKDGTDVAKKLLMLIGINEMRSRKLTAAGWSRNSLDRDVYVHYDEVFRACVEYHRQSMGVLNWKRHYLYVMLHCVANARRTMAWWTHAITTNPVKCDVLSVVKHTTPLRISQAPGAIALQPARIGTELPTDQRVAPGPGACAAGCSKACASTSASTEDDSKSVASDDGGLPQDCAGATGGGKVLGIAKAPDKGRDRREVDSKSASESSGPPKGSSKREKSQREAKQAGRSDVHKGGTAPPKGSEVHKPTKAGGKSSGRAHRVDTVPDPKGREVHAQGRELRPTSI